MNVTSRRVTTSQLIRSTTTTATTRPGAGIFGDSFDAESTGLGLLLLLTRIKCMRQSECAVMGTLQAWTLAYVSIQASPYILTIAFWSET